MYNPCAAAKMGYWASNLQGAGYWASNLQHVGYWAPVGIRYAQVQSKAVSPTIGRLGQLPAGGGLLVLAGLAYFIFRKK